MPQLGIVIVNLGTPNAPTRAALRKYLAEFLSDPRVIEIPSVLWKILLYSVILPTRPARSAHAYAKIWTAQGSPLLVATQDLGNKIQTELAQYHQADNPLILQVAMRYGQPAISEVLQQMQQQQVEKIIVLPLYPQYSSATTGSVADAVFTTLSQWRWIPEVHLLGAYYDDPKYIQALAETIEQHWQQDGQAEKLIVSFHGMRQTSIDAGDPYYQQCKATALHLVEQLQLSAQQWEMVFQSRFGKAQWLQPYAIERLVALPKEGIKHISLICPGFAVDCLETLEEIAIAGKQHFLAAGGEKFDYIPALNASTAHAHFLSQRLLPLL